MARPPILFIHGAANGAWVWQFWQREMRALGWDANVMDLRGHGLSMPADFETSGRVTASTAEYQTVSFTRIGNGFMSLSSREPYSRRLVPCGSVSV